MKRTAIVCLLLLLALGACQRSVASDAAPSAATSTPSAASLPLAASVALAPPASPADLAARIAGSIIVGNGAMKYLRDLSDHHGSRLTGTPGYADAAKWAKGQLEMAGVDATRTEPFTISHGWQRGAVTARVVLPMERALHVESTGWSPATKGTLRAEVVVMKDATPEKIKADAAHLAGKIVLLAPSDTPRARKGKRPRLAEPLRDAGVAALLVGNARADNVLTAHAAHVGNDLGGAFPSFDLGKEDSKSLERLTEEGALTVELSNASALTGPIDVVNVVGEIRGREKPNEWIIVCAHLDAWDYATGSQDNGAGVATVLEVASHMPSWPAAATAAEAAATRAPPNRSGRFPKTRRAST